jgi:plastocyanin domain-containing protein
MDTAEWMVLLGGIAAVAWLNWYFFVAGGTAVQAVATQQGGRPEITVRVHGGYDPAVIRVQKGRPVRLLFDRQESASCSEEVVFGDFGIRRYLPAFEKTPIDLTPGEVGKFEFTCGMGMMRGRLVVEE